LILGQTVLALLAVAAPAQVSFPSDDRGVVHADLYGSGDHGVVLAHAGWFTKESWAAAQAAIEAKEGELDRKGRKPFITARDNFRGGGTLRLPETREQYERAQFIFETDQAERLMAEILRFLSD